MIRYAVYVDELYGLYKMFELDEFRLRFDTDEH